MEYDGTNRRTVKMVANCGDWDCTYQYVWDRNWRLLEVRNGSGETLKQTLWGGRYIDELVQVAINTDPDDEAEQVCDPPSRRPLRRAAVLGIADADGVLVERYEYTPYGQRTVYRKSGPDDALTTAPLYHSQQVADATTRHPYTLCDIGHQGLMHDREFGLWYNRYRYGDPSGRWPQRDFSGYIDGANLYGYLTGEPANRLDPTGEQVAWPNEDDYPNEADYQRALEDAMTRAGKPATQPGKGCLCRGGTAPVFKVHPKAYEVSATLGAIPGRDSEGYAAWTKRASETILTKVEEHFAKEGGDLETIRFPDRERNKIVPIVDPLTSGTSGWIHGWTIRAWGNGCCCTFPRSRYAWKGWFAVIEETGRHRIGRGLREQDRPASGRLPGGITCPSVREHERWHVEGIDPTIRGAAERQYGFAIRGAEGFLGGAKRQVDKAKAEFDDLMCKRGKYKDLKATPEECKRAANEIMNQYFKDEKPIYGAGQFHDRIIVHDTITTILSE